MGMMQTYLKECQSRANVALKKRLPSPNKQPRKLNRAINYGVLNGGKRLRSAMIFATGEAFGADKSVLDDLSAAVEMIHAFSLIHDDLPALDNDDLRRGKPTCHKAFDEATAILAGDALQSLAFEIISEINHENLPSQIIVQMIQTLARAIGPQGMAGGEELDLEMVNQRVSAKQLENMYRLKTSCLLQASILLAALAANCQDKEILLHLNQFAEDIGVAFQIHDDIIGIESDTKTLGKKQGNDLELNKPVYPVVVGMARAKRRRDFLYRRALDHLDQIPHINTEKLKAIAAFFIERNY